MGNRDGHRQGDENLDLMKDAPRYTKYVGGLVGRLLPSAGFIVEIGSGNGQQTRAVISPSERLVCVEPSRQQQASLRQLGYTVVENVCEIPFDSVDALFSLNCFEHVEDDTNLLRQSISKMPVGGRVVIFVPALPILFSEMDARVGHVRRYTKKSLCKLLNDAGVAVEHLRYVDSIGALLSLLYRVLPLSTGEPSSWTIRFYDLLLLPVSRLIDTFCHRFIGKNLLVVGSKK